MWNIKQKQMNKIQVKKQINTYRQRENGSYQKGKGVGRGQRR